jgi:hypothetical protein
VVTLDGYYHQWPWCRNPTLRECEDETHSRNVNFREFQRTPESSEINFKGQNTSHRGVLYIIEKISKCRCPKWARMTHLDICNISYGQKKGRESNWQFDSRPWSGTPILFLSFQDSHLGVSGQKVIWMPLPQSGAEYIIWGKVVASPEPW